MDHLEVITDLLLTSELSNFLILNLVLAIVVEIHWKLAIILAKKLAPAQVEIDGPTHFCLDGTPTGSTVLKRQVRYASLQRAPLESPHRHLRTEPLPYAVLAIVR